MRRNILFGRSDIITYVIIIRPHDLTCIYITYLSIVKLKSPLRKLYGRHHDIVDRYGIYVSQIIEDMFRLS